MMVETIDGLMASQPERESELRKLRQQVLDGEVNLTIRGAEAGSDALQVQGNPANAVYRSGVITVDQRLIDGAQNATGSARLLAALAEEYGGWAAERLGLQFRNDQGVMLDTGAVIGLQTMARLTSQAAANGSSLMFSLNLEGVGERKYATAVPELTAATLEQYTPERLLLNAHDANGSAQLAMRFDPRNMAAAARTVFGAGADSVITNVGFIAGVASKGVEAAHGLMSLQRDLLGANLYITAKLLGADWLARPFKDSYDSVNGLVTTVKRYVVRPEQRQNPRRC